MKIGSHYSENSKCEFVVWSPFAKSLELLLKDDGLKIQMEKDEQDYWRISTEVSPGAKYFFIINGDNQKPDPASNYQPEGVHGASQIVDHNIFKWEDKSWQGIALDQMIVYELHVGTFTSHGTFNSLIDKLEYLIDLGINMIEIMPVAQFPGSRNWGYDGVYPFAVQNTYGSCDDFKRLINECHKKNLGVVLDVVYNHLGPEGNYTTQYGPYFTSHYKSGWGDAINFDGEYSDHVRNYFIENALYWLKNFHIDALRLDAVHSIFDMSVKHFLQELKEKVGEFSVQNGRERYLIAESDLNDVKMINPVEVGGYNIDAQWSDDFHHSVHAYLTNESSGYYKDFGKPFHIKKALAETFVYSGQYSNYRKKKHGSSAEKTKPYQFVISIQNHDQVGNRALGERLSSIVEFEKLKLAAGLMIFSPYIPLLFMGEEYAEESPFLYFVSHSDEKLIEGIRKGRREEFKSFGWQNDLPDPQSEETFLKSRLNWDLKESGRNKTLLNFYKKIIEIKKTNNSFQNKKRDDFYMSSLNDDKVIIIERFNSQNSTYSFFNLDEKNSEIEISFKDNWKKLFDSSSKNWNGAGEVAPNEVIGKSKIVLQKFNFVLYGKQEEKL